jgi:nucleotide-binding universal stress UspA family protein
MPVIIAATDFSNAGNNAVHYAHAMASAYGCALHIVHSYVIPVAYGDTPVPLVPVDDGREIAEGGMSQLTAQLAAGPEVLTHIIYGDITDALQEYTGKVQPWMIVVGNSADEDTKFWLGSNLISELKDLPYNVLAVPPTAIYQPVKNVCLACDFKQVTDSFPAADVVEIIQRTGCTLHVLNVDHDNKHFALEMPLNSELIHQHLSPADPQYHYIDNEDVENGITGFVEEKGMDWLAVIPHKHSFFEGLFRKSHTKALARMSNVPLLALHEKEKK